MLLPVKSMLTPLYLACGAGIFCVLVVLAHNQVDLLPCWLI